MNIRNVMTMLSILIAGMVAYYIVATLGYRSETVWEGWIGTMLLVILVTAGSWPRLRRLLF